MLGLGGVGNLHASGIPLDLPAGPVGDVAEMACFSEGAGSGERAGRFGPSLACLDPFGVVTDRVRDGLGWRFEVLEFLFGEKEVFGVFGEDHAALGADEEGAVLPLGNVLLVPDARFSIALSCGRGRSKVVLIA